MATDFFKETAWLNNLAYSHYCRHIYDLVLSQFEWSLPDTMDERTLESALCCNARAILFKDDVMGYLSLPFTPGSNFDVYGYPNSRVAYSKYNHYRNKLTPKNSVVVWNNFSRTFSVDDIIYYARMLYNCDRIAQVNINAHKTPVILQMAEKERLTMQQLLMQYDGNQPFVYGDKSMNFDSIKVLDLRAPWVASQIQEVKEKLWNECLTHLGISNVNITKKERMNVDEVNRNLGGTVSSRYTKLIMRQLACKQFNKMFGEDIWCEFREEVDTSIPSTAEEVEFTEETEVESDE